MMNRLEETIIKFKKTHGDKFDYSKVTFKSLKTKVIIICKEHGEFLQAPSSHMSGQGCPSCSKNKKLDNETFVKRGNEIHDNKYDYSKVECNGVHNKVIIICKEHGEFLQEPNNHLNSKQGCPMCISNKKTNVNEFIEKANKIHNNRYDYSKCVYINNRTKMDIICNKHGIFKQNANNHLNSKQGCPSCRESKGEKEIHRILSEGFIIFIRQKRFNDCRYKLSLPFDFYIEKLNLCIEFDGEQHKRMSRIWGKVSFNNTIRNDRIKTKYCLDKNIELIRIGFDDDMCSILREIIERYNSI